MFPIFSILVSMQTNGEKVYMLRERLSFRNIVLCKIRKFKFCYFRSLQTPPMDPSSSLSMTHPTGWGIQFSHSRSTPASSPSMTSRYTHPEEWQFGRSTPQSIKEGTEMSSNCGSYCPEYSTATFGNNVRIFHIIL